MISTWKGNPWNTHKHVTVTGPKQLTSVGWLESPPSGLVAHMSWRLTTKRYKYATVFVDHISELSYVYLPNIASVEEALEAKQISQQHILDKGVAIYAYYADNVIFKANNWEKAWEQEGKKLTSAGANTHFINSFIKNLGPERYHPCHTNTCIHQMEKLHHSKRMVIHYDDGKWRYS